MKKEQEHGGKICAVSVQRATHCRITAATGVLCCLNSHKLKLVDLFILGHRKHAYGPSSNIF